MNKDKMLPEYRIKKSVERIDLETLNRFKKYQSAPVSDAMWSRNTLDACIKPVWNNQPTIVGTAITVNASVGDEILALKAIEYAEEGDVIIIAGNSEPYTAYWGGIMSTMAKVKGVHAMITDGMIRDVDQCEELEFPIWATGVTPVAPKTDIPPGDLNFPITIGEVIIYPGDLVIADNDGVAIVPRSSVNEVANAVDERLKMEDKWLEDIYSTKEMILKEKIDSLLQKRNVKYY